MAESSSSAAKRSRKRARVAIPDLYEIPDNPPQDAEVYVPIVDHAWLRFHPNTEYYKVLKKIYRRPYFAGFGIDWDWMTKVGLKERAEDLLDLEWRRVLRVNRDICFRVPTWEVLSTFRYSDATRNPRATGCVEFRLGGQKHSMTLIDFGVRVGIIDMIESGDPDYEIGAYPADIEESLIVQHWPQIADGFFDPTHARYRWYRDPLHRYIHRLITHTIHARKNSTERVTKIEAFIMYCLVNKIKVNVAHLLASSFSRAWSKSTITLSPYVTRLGVSLGVLMEDTAGDLETFSSPLKMGEEHLSQTDIIELQADGKYLLAPPRPTPEIPAGHQGPPLTQPPPMSYPLPQATPPSTGGTSARLAAIEHTQRWIVAELTRAAQTPAAPFVPFTPLPPQTGTAADDDSEGTEDDMFETAAGDDDEE